MERTQRIDADLELERRIKNYLQGRHQPALRNLEVEAQGGTVTLRGTVRSFYEKQLGQQCCRRVAGVVRLIDSIEVAAAKTAREEAEPALSC